MNNKTLDTFIFDEYDLDRFTQKIWEGNTVYYETVCFTEKDGSILTSQLLYKPDNILAVRSLDMKTVYKEGKDFTVSNKTIIRTENSNIPYLPFNIYAEKGLKRRVLAEHPYYGVAYPVYTPKYQVAVYYTHSDSWQGSFVPISQVDYLPKTMHRLLNNMPLKIIFYGDSILTGCDTSGSTEITVGNGTNHIYGTGEIDWKIEKPPVSPYTPAWPEMVKQKLERFYNNTKIIKVNRSSCSTDSTGGLKAIDINVSDENPDLVIIGFGGNECNIDPKLYRQNIEGMIKRIRLKNPATEILLLSTIVLNFEICDFRINKLKEFEQELCAIRENYSGIGVVQINSLFNCINDELGKKYFDYTYNNINHPNDFGVSVLAQAVLTALGI